MTPKTQLRDYFKWPDRLLIMTKGKGGAAYAQTKAWSNLLLEDTGIKIVVKGGMDDTPEKYQYLKEGRFFASPMTIAEFMLTAEHPNFAKRGLGAGQFRIFYPLSTYYLGYAVQGDSEINSPYDLKGKDVLYLSLYGEASKNLMRALLAWGNIADHEVNWIPVHSTWDFGPYMRDGKGDVSYGSMIEPQWIEAESSPRGIKWIELDTAADPSAAARFETVLNMNISWGVCTQGVPSALGVKTIEIIVSYYTTAMYDERLVYRIVKWLHENYERYKDRHVNFTTMTIDILLKAAETDYIPLHNGAVKYLKELGTWTDAHESRWQQNIALLTKWEEAFQRAIDIADDKGIAVSSESEEWLKLWADYNTSLNLPKFIGPQDCTMVYE